MAAAASGGFLSFWRAPRARSTALRSTRSARQSRLLRSVLNHNLRSILIHALALRLFQDPDGARDCDRIAHEFPRGQRARASLEGARRQKSPSFVARKSLSSAAARGARLVARRVGKSPCASLCASEVGGPGSDILRRDRRHREPPWRYGRLLGPRPNALAVARRTRRRTATPAGGRRRRDEQARHARLRASQTRAL